MIYRLPNDLKRFKTLTTGHTVIMGRKTFESLPKGALPNRRNVVLSRQADLGFPQTKQFASLEEAIDSCAKEEELFVIGGAEIYRQAMPLADKLYLTRVEDITADADTFFPCIDECEWEETDREAHPADEKHHYPYTFINYVRRNKAGV